MSNHTPGPWFTDTDGDGKDFALVTSTHDKDGPDDDVCEVYGGNCDDDDTREANARLISAAPELLELVKSLVDTREKHFISNEGDGLYGWDERARAAINKAKGAA